MRRLFAVTTFLIATLATSANAQTAHQREFAAWQPQFRSAWQNDACVQSRQSWDDYFGWVHQFYFDGSGWFNTMDGLVATVKDGAAAARISTQLTTLGRRVAAEWSKDNSCRRIDTFGPHGIVHFSDTLQSARSRDRGDGAAIQAAVDQVQSEVDAEIGGR